MKAPDPSVLVARERPVPAEPAGVRERVLARVHETVGTPPGPGSGGGGGGGAGGAGASVSGVKLGLVAAAAVGLAALIVVLGGPSASPSETPTDTTSTALRAQSAPLPQSAPAAARGPSAAPSGSARRSVPAFEVGATAQPAPAGTPVQPVRAAPPTPPAPAPFARDARVFPPHGRERALLDRAQLALSERDAAAALAAIDEHAKRFPRGALAEERDALRIRAFLVAGKKGEARAAFVAFSKRFPSSIHLAGFEEVLGR